MSSPRKKVTSPSSKDFNQSAQVDKSSHSDPIASLNIQEVLRNEANLAKIDSAQKDAEIVRLNSQIQRLRSNQSCIELIERLKSKQGNDTYKQELINLQAKFKSEIQRLRSQLASKKADKVFFPTDSFIQKQSSSAALEAKSLRDQIKMLTDTNKQLGERLAEAKSGSQASRALEAEFNDLRNKMNGYEKQLAEKENTNRTLADQNSSLRKKANNFDSQIAAKKEAGKKQSASYKRLVGLFQSIAQNDRKNVNPAKGISEGAEIDANKLTECEKYASLVVQSIKDTISKYATSETTNITEIGRLNDLIDDIKRQRDSKQSQLKKERANSVSLTNRITGLQDKFKQESTLRSSAQATCLKLTSTVNEQKTTITNLQDKKKALTASVEQLQLTKKQKLATIKTKTDKIEDLQRQNKQLKSDVVIIQGNLQKKTNQVDRAKTTITNLEGDKKVLAADLTKAKNELAIANDNIKTKNSRISSLEQSQRKLKDKVKHLDDGMKRLEDDLNEINRKFANAESEINSLNYNLKREKDDHKRSSSVIDNINKMMVVEASHFFTGKSKSLQRTGPNESDKLKEEIQAFLEEWKASHMAAQFFNGSTILPRESVRWIIENLHNYMKETPIATRLVHRFDPLNATNFHQYIDEVPNLLVLVHLANGAKIGGFTVFPVTREQREFPGRGFLFSITDSKVYHIKKDPRKAVVNYDDYFFILGNAELRLRQEKKEDRQRAIVFSTLGTASTTFDSMKDTRIDFLKTTDKTENDQPVESFEFYQVIFEQ